MRFQNMQYLCAIKQTDMKTEAHKRMKEDKMAFYKKQPYYGRPTAKKIYETMHAGGINVLQVSHCGPYINVVAYKKDEDAVCHIMTSSFGVIQKRYDELTGLVMVRHEVK